MSVDAPRLRIAHVVATDEFAGTERYVCDVAGELARRGHDVRVFGGERVSMLAALGSGVRWAPAPDTATAVKALVTGGRVDVLHSHLAYADFSASVASTVIGGARISTRHILTPRGIGRVSARVGQVARSRLFEVAVSEFVAANVHPRSDAVIVNGVPTAPEAPPDGGPAERAVLVAHRLVPEKGTDDALRAWAATDLPAQGWQLWIAGRGPDESRLRALADETGAGSGVRFLGWVPDMPALLSRVQVFLATSPAEPLGLSVLEAMAHGVAVVASDAGGHRETVGSVPGAALYPPGDAAQAAVLLSRLAGDDDARRAYGDALREAQRERFSLTAHVDALEAVYLTRTSRRRAGGTALRTRASAR